MLFFAGIVVVVPSARDAAVEYVNVATARLAAESPYSEIILVCIGLIGILLLLLMRQPAPERTVVYRIRTEVPGPAGLVAERPSRDIQPKPFRKAPTLRRRSNAGAQPIGWLPKLLRMVSHHSFSR